MWLTNPIKHVFISRLLNCGVDSYASPITIALPNHISRPRGKSSTFHAFHSRTSLSNVTCTAYMYSLRPQYPKSLITLLLFVGKCLRQVALPAVEDNLPVVERNLCHLGAKAEYFRLRPKRGYTRTVSVLPQLNLGLAESSRNFAICEYSALQSHVK